MAYALVSALFREQRQISALIPIIKERDRVEIVSINFIRYGQNDGTKGGLTDYLKRHRSLAEEQLPC